MRLRDNLLRMIGRCTNEAGMFTVSCSKCNLLFTLLFGTSGVERIKAKESTPRHRLYGCLDVCTQLTAVTLKFEI